MLDEEIDLAVGEAKRHRWDRLVVLTLVGLAVRARHQGFALLIREHDDGPTVLYKKKTQEET